MKRTCILLLALMPLAVMAQDYKYIDIDRSDAEGRQVMTEMIPAICDSKVYGFGMGYTSNSNDHLYHITLVAINDRKAEILQGDKITFKMADDSSVTLSSLYDSSCEYHSSRYSITTSFLIPETHIYDMLNAVISISFDFRENGKIKHRTLHLSHDTASEMMMAYLELLAATGK